jgi:hypothetical protein
MKVKMSTAKLQETQKTLSKSIGQYDELLSDKISEDQLDSALGVVETDLKQTTASQPITVCLCGRQAIKSFKLLQ